MGERYTRIKGRSSKFRESGIFPLLGQFPMTPGGSGVGPASAIQRKDAQPYRRYGRL